MDDFLYYDELLISELQKIRREIAYPDGIFKINSGPYWKLINLFDQMERDLDIVLGAMAKDHLYQMNYYELLNYEKFYTLDYVVYKNMCFEAVMWVGQPGISGQEILARKAACMCFKKLRRASAHIHDLAVLIED